MAFKPGQSGNPNGRPKGTGKAIAFRDALDKHRMDLVAKTVELALAGDFSALKMCLDRIYPPLKTREEPIMLPFQPGDSLVKKGDIVIQATAEGEIPPDIAARLLQGLANQARLIETTELTTRIAALEAAIKGEPSDRNTSIVTTAGHAWPPGATLPASAGRSYRSVLIGPAGRCWAILPTGTGRSC